jgi:hypothetical protein
MKPLSYFIGGVLTGAVLLYAMGYRTESEYKEQLKQELLQSLYLSNQSQVNTVQYVEIRGKKGIVTIHTGMPKDSVKSMVGKPDQVDLRNIAGVPYEDWGYKIMNEYVSDLDLEFEDGKLKNVRQR